MKHPVDTSQWGEFKLGDLFEFTGCKQVKSQHNLIETDKENGIPFVVQSNANNMVKCYVTRESLIDNGETIYDGNTIMLGVMTPVSSYQEREFGASQSISLRAPFLNPLRGLFMVATIQAVIEPKYNYANIPGIQKYKQDTIPLPLKPSADLSNYDQTDIDWDYMETVMSRVTARAKDRLASLPQPSEKQKTPVDTSGWGEFIVGELFDCEQTKAMNPKSDGLIKGDTPFITSTVVNNGIADYYHDPDNLFTRPGECITISAIGRLAFYQTTDFIPAYKVYALRHSSMNQYSGLFICSLFNSYEANYNYANIRSMKKLKAETIKLPLKPSADPSNYSQDDIDWTYMEGFMKAIEEKAHHRLKTLQKTIA